MYQRFRLEMYLAATILLITGAFVGGLALNGKLDMREPVEAEYVQNNNHEGYRLVVFEQAGCGACEKFHEVVEPWYVKSSYQEKAHLTYAHIRNQRRFKLNTVVSLTPTIVLVDPQGYEVSRMIGVPDHRDLSRMIERRLGT